MRWEYKIVYFTSEPLDNEAQYESRLHDGVHILNDLGSHGWELVQFLEHPVTKSMVKCHAVLKRPIAD